MLTRAMAFQADLVLGMTAGHVDRARFLVPDARVELLGSYAHGLDDLDGPGVPDPVGAPVAVYEETYRVLDELVGMAMDRIAEGLKKDGASTEGRS